MIQFKVYDSNDIDEIAIKIIWKNTRNLNWTQTKYQIIEANIAKLDCKGGRRIWIKVFIVIIYYDVIVKIIMLNALVSFPILGNIKFCCIG